MGDSRIVIPVLVSVLILGSSGLSQQAFAVQTSITNQATCEAAPVLGTFDSGTCILSGTHTIPFADFWDFFIDVEVTGTVDAFGILQFRTTLSNSGTINVIGDPGGASLGLLIFVLGTDYTNECSGIINLIGGTGSFSGRFILQGNLGVAPIFNNFGTITGTNSNAPLRIATVELFSFPDIPVFNNHGTLTAPVDTSGGTGNSIFNDDLPNQCSIEVDIDIKPGSDPNCINEKKKGQTPMAILGSDSFDVTTIDQSTLELDDDDDSGTAGISPTKITVKDVDKDGFDDLVLKFANQDMKDEGFLVDNNELFVTGELNDNTPIIGSDIINLAGGPNCF